MKVFCTYCGAANAAGAEACMACATPIGPTQPRVSTQPRSTPSGFPITGTESQTQYSPYGPHPLEPQPYPFPQAQPPGQAGSRGDQLLQPDVPYGQAPYPAQQYGPSYGAVPSYPPPAVDQDPSLQGWGYYPPQPQGAYGGQPPQYAPAPLYPPPARMQSPYPVPQSYGSTYGAGPGYTPVPAYGAVAVPGGPGSLATTLPRFGAFLFDAVMYLVLAFVAMAVVGLLNIPLLGALLVLGIHPLYHIGFWATTGRTPGYKAAGLQLIKTDGTRPGVGASVVRYIGWQITNVFFYLGCLWMIWDYNKQALYDKMANTLVIRA